MAQLKDTIIDGNLEVNGFLDINTIDSKDTIDSTDSVLINGEGDC